VGAWTHKVATGSTTDGTSFVSGSFTPTVGQLLVVYVAAMGSVAAAPTLTASANGITFSLCPTTAIKNVSADTVYCFVANQLTPASPAAMTVTFACTADAATACVIIGGEASGMSRLGLAAIKQAKDVDNVLAGTAPATVFATAALTTSIILFGQSSTVGTARTAPTTPVMTKNGETFTATPTGGAFVGSANSGFTGTTITSGNASNGACCALSVELDTTSASTAYAVSGTAAATSAASGDVTRTALAFAVTGTAAVVSAASGDVTRTGLALAVSGTAAVVSAASGAVTRTGLPVSGTAAAVSAASGDVTRTLRSFAVTGTAAAVSAASGDVTRTLRSFAVTGTAPAASGASGDVTRTALAFAVTGTAAAISSAQGDATRTLRSFAVTGTAAAVSAASGDVTKTTAGPQAYPVSGTAAAVAAASGNVTRTLLALAVSGTAVSSSTASGAVTRTTLSAAVSGTVTALSGASGAVTRTALSWPVSGTSTAVSGASGDVTAPNYVPVTHARALLGTALSISLPWLNVYAGTPKAVRAPALLLRPGSPWVSPLTFSRSNVHLTATLLTRNGTNDAAVTQLEADVWAVIAALDAAGAIVVDAAAPTLRRYGPAELVAVDVRVTVDVED
jgi:hypothetical protein